VEEGENHEESSDTTALYTVRSDPTSNANSDHESAACASPLRFLCRVVEQAEEKVVLIRLNGCTIWAYREWPSGSGLLNWGWGNRTQWGCAISFFSSLFGGANSNLNTDIGATGQLAGNLTGQGQSYTNQAGNFWSGILSGDPSKQMQLLGPAINAAKTSANQDMKTASMFAPRSGGTAAANAATADKTHGYISDLIGNLTGSAAGNLGSLGTNLTSMGLGAYSQNAEFSQQRMANWNNSILGKGITGAVQGAEALGMGAAGGALPGGPGAAAGAQGAFASFLNG
jgi:hypothetical protein